MTTVCCEYKERFSVKRILSIILSIITVVSILPVASAEETVQSEVVEETDVEFSEADGIFENYGKEVETGNTLYYIEDGALFVSENYSRPSTIDTDVTWIVKDGECIYYSRQYNGR